MSSSEARPLMHDPRRGIRDLQVQHGSTHGAYSLIVSDIFLLLELQAAQLTSRPRGRARQDSTHRCSIARGSEDAAPLRLTASLERAGCILPSDPLAVWLRGQAVKPSSKPPKLTPTHSCAMLGTDCRGNRDVGAAA